MIGEWISVKDRLPEDGQEILIYVTVPGNMPIQVATCIDGDGELWLDSGYSFGDDVTHWMELPEPPKVNA